jgi:DNA-binding MarR family transcriptional regulator
MTTRRDAGEVAGALRVGIGSVVRRLKQVQPDGGLSMPETSALSQIDREGPTTCSVLAKREHITPQSMGVTLSTLETRGLLQRRADPDDGRRAVISLTRAGRDVLYRQRDESTEIMTRALAATFTAPELELLRAAATLLERLAHAL